MNNISVKVKGIVEYNGKYLLIQKWYDDNIGQFERPRECEKPAPPHLDGNMVYRLRCAFLHEGNPDAAKENGSLDKFELIVETEKPFHIYNPSIISKNRCNNTTCNCSSRIYPARNLRRRICSARTRCTYRRCNRIT